MLNICSKNTFPKNCLRWIFNISPTVLKKINDFKFLGKKKAAVKEFVDDVGQVCAFYCQAKIFHKTLKSFNREGTIKNVSYENLSQFNETLDLNLYKKHLSRKDGSVN